MYLLAMCVPALSVGAEWGADAVQTKNCVVIVQLCVTLMTECDGFLVSWCPNFVGSQ